MPEILIQLLAGCSLLFLLLGYSSFRRAKREKARLAMGAMAAPATAGGGTGPGRPGLQYRMLALLSKAGFNMSPFTLLLTITGVLTAFYFLGLVLFGKASVAVGCSPLGLILAYFYLRTRIDKRADDLVDQMEDWLTMINVNLQAGLTLEQALLSVTPRLKGLIRAESERIVRSVKMGSTALQAMEGVAGRIPAVEYKMILTAVDLNERIGGNLIKSLDDIVATIRDRRESRNKARNMAAQGKMASTVVGLVPLVLIFVFRILSPGYMDSLYDSFIGQAVFVITLCMAVLGWWKIRTMSRIRISGGR
ncbi:MAG: type II secretion system F family protein [Bacillota bacterium]